MQNANCHSPGNAEVQTSKTSSLFHSNVFTSLTGTDIFTAIWKTAVLWSDRKIRGRRKGNEEENETNLLSPLPCLWERCTQPCRHTSQDYYLKKICMIHAQIFTCLLLIGVQSALNTSSWFQITARGSSTIKFLTATQTITLFSSMWGHHTPSGKHRGMIPLQASSERDWQWCIMRLVVTSFQYS